MRILFDGRVLEGTSSGVRDIAAGLVAGLRELHNRDQVHLAVATVGDTEQTDVRIPAPLFMHVGLPVAALRGKFDRVLVPRQTTPLLPLVRRVPVFHDVGFIERPDLYRGTRSITTTTRLASRSRAALAVSKYTADRMAALRLKSDAVPLDIGAVHSIAWSPDIYAPYILCIAAQEPHKNIPALVEAWGELGDPDITLVLCGRVGSDTDAVRSAVSKLRNPSSVRIASGLGDDEYARLLQGAMGYVQPSLYEGLCIPAMDMAAAGVPMIVADVSNLGMRFAGSPTGQCVDATNRSAFVESLRRLVHDADFRSASSSFNKANVRMTDWTAVARRVVEVV